jgi:hypothetical protein
MRGGVPVSRNATVREAATAYLAWFEKHRKGVAMARSAINTHILPALGDRRIAALTTAELREWRDSLATKRAQLRTSKLAPQCPPCGQVSR